MLNSSLGLQILQGHHGRRHLSNDRRKDPGRPCDMESGGSESKDIQNGPKNHPTKNGQRIQLWPSYTSHVCNEITPFKRMYNPTEIASSNL